MSFDMKYGRCLFICQLLINLSLWNQISMVYIIILQCCYILKFLPVLISVYIFSVFLFWYFDFSNRGQSNVLTSLSFDDIRCCLSKTKQETNKHALSCIIQHYEFTGNQSMFWRHWNIIMPSTQTTKKYGMQPTKKNTMD